jgi:quercetin dioxygenase-like cupin family protein
VSRFVRQAEIREERFEWGKVLWRCVPENTGAGQIVVMDVTLDTGGHDFHYHPGQEEMIVVKAGRIEQWIDRESAVLGPGDSVYIDADVVHASFVLGDEPAQLQVVLGPAVGDSVGYVAVDAFEEEPWASLRSSR